MMPVKNEARARFASPTGFGMLPCMSSPVRVRASSLLVLFALSFSGCAYGEMRYVLRSQVAKESGCADLMVQKQSPYAPGYTPNNYVIRGCGIERVYSCQDDGGLVKYGSAQCSYKATNVPPPAAAPTPATEPGGPDEGPAPDEDDAPSS
jgi:hypothetical protein